MLRVVMKKSPRIQYENRLENLKNLMKFNFSELHFMFWLNKI